MSSVTIPALATIFWTDNSKKTGLYMSGMSPEVLSALNQGVWIKFPTERRKYMATSLPGLASTLRHLATVVSSFLGHWPSACDLKS